MCIRYNIMCKAELIHSIKLLLHILPFLISSQSQYLKLRTNHQISLNLYTYFYTCRTLKIIVRFLFQSFNPSFTPQRIVNVSIYHYYYIRSNQLLEGHDNRRSLFGETCRRKCTYVYPRFEQSFFHILEQWLNRYMLNGQILQLSVSIVICMYVCALCTIIHSMYTHTIHFYFLNGLFIYKNYQICNWNAFTCYICRATVVRCAYTWRETLPCLLITIGNVKFKYKSLTFYYKSWNKKNTSLFFYKFSLNARHIITFLKSISWVTKVPSEPIVLRFYLLINNIHLPDFLPEHPETTKIDGAIYMPIYIAPSILVVPRYSAYQTLPALPACFTSVILLLHYFCFFYCTFFAFCLLEIAIFTIINCDDSSKAMHHSTLKKDDVSRVRIKVFRGPTQNEGSDEFFATWGYWIQQPGNKHITNNV
ncbi:hypothetical protein PUN28_013510 [Cardiocondyla obscurior]|uniref:Uncharacterized protein n=1 Tax=Cardiocondyla obscurior TaxID=286306 RepID=A0AAW2F1S9_9HYME